MSPPAKSKGQVCSELGTKGLSFGAKALMTDRRGAPSCMALTVA